MDQNWEDDVDQICEHRKGVRDILMLVRVNGVNDAHFEGHI
jgi:hypothetical protein